MTADLLGNPVSCASAGALAGVNAFVDGMLCYETKAVEVLAAAEEAPDDCLANVYAAMLWMLSETTEAPEKAQPFLARAESAAPRAHARERQTLAMARAWAEGDIARALELGARINEAYPRDLLMLKMRHYFLFNAGDAVGMLQAVEALAPENRDVAVIHGIRAFALEQCHLLEDAEAAARAGLAMKGNDPWAQHALAHVMLTQGRIDEGAAFMAEASRHWTGLNSFMATHNWWHLALFNLRQGRAEAALHLYDTQIWGVDKTYSQDQIGAVSLLARLEFAGVDVGERWEDLAAHLRARAEDIVQPFLTLQYLFGLARAGAPEAARLLRIIRARADQEADLDEGEVWRDVAAPAAEGIAAHAGGRFDVAAEKLGRVLPRMMEVGGSHAQRDLFEQIWLDALVRDGQFAAAQPALELRRQRDREGAPINTLLGEVYDGLGLGELAQAARARAEATQRRHSVSPASA